jgi:entericidin B
MEQTSGQPGFKKDKINLNHGLNLYRHGPLIAPMAQKTCSVMAHATKQHGDMTKEVHTGGVAKRQTFANLADITIYLSKEASMKRVTAIAILCTTVLLLVSGCNTIRGAGEDIEQGGEAIQQSAS